MIALRNVASVTTAGFTFCSMIVAHRRIGGTQGPQFPRMIARSVPPTIPLGFLSPERSGLPGELVRMIVCPLKVGKSKVPVQSLCSARNREQCQPQFVLLRVLVFDVKLSQKVDHSSTRHRIASVCQFLHVSQQAAAVKVMSSANPTPKRKASGTMSIGDRS